MQIVLAYFEDFFKFLHTELSTSLLISPSLVSLKLELLLFSWSFPRGNKIKRRMLNRTAYILS